MRNNNAPKVNTLSQDLFVRLRRDILSGEFEAGAKLSEQSICDEYAVSRTPVREAFQKLELEGIIEIIPNRGAFVADFTKQDIEDTYEIMKALESVAIKMAIDRIRPEEIELLHEKYELTEFYTLKRDLEKLRDINEEFHNTIYQASRSSMLMQVLQSCQTRLRNNQYRKELGLDYLEETMAEHEAIFMAIVARDKETAAAAAVRHIRNGKKRADL